MSQPTFLASNASGASLFSDGKAPEALRTIGEVASALGLRQHVLRYWEDQFPMLQPLKRSGGRRYYRVADVHLIERIHQLVHQQGYTLKGAKAALSANGGGETDADQASEVPMLSGAQTGASHPDGLIEALIAVRNRLAAAL
jgi:DNA-binding transcriptional MerR regulator